MMSLIKMLAVLAVLSLISVPVNSQQCNVSRCDKCDADVNKCEECETEFTLNDSKDKCEDPRAKVILIIIIVLAVVFATAVCIPLCIVLIVFLVFCGGIGLIVSQSKKDDKFKNTNLANGGGQNNAEYK